MPLSRNLGTLTSWNRLGLSRPVMGLLCLTFTITIYRHISELSSIQIYPYYPNAFTMWHLINHNTKRIILQMHTEIKLEFEPAVVHQKGSTVCRKTLSVAARNVSSITGTCGQALHIRPYKIKRESI